MIIKTPAEVAREEETKRRENTEQKRKATQPDVLVLCVAPYGLSMANFNLISESYTVVPTVKLDLKKY